MEAVWLVEDGVIVCKGEPLGHLVTGYSCQDFKLTLEWRWAAEQTNSGVLLRIASDPIGFIPTCVEAQLTHKTAGDIWAFRGAPVDGHEERWMTSSTSPPGSRMKNLSPPGGIPVTISLS